MLLADYDAKLDAVSFCKVLDACRWKYSHHVFDAVLIVNI